MEQRQRPSISPAALYRVTELPGAGNPRLPRELEQRFGDRRDCIVLLDSDALCAVLEGKHGYDDAARLELAMTCAADPHATLHDDGLCTPAGVVDELRDQRKVLA